MSDHVTYWHTLSCACMPYKWLCFCVLLCTVWRTVIQSLYFKPDLQEDNFTELLAMQHKLLTNEDLMELETQRKDGERERKK